MLALQGMARQIAEEYLDRVRQSAAHLALPERQAIVDRVAALIELEVGVAHLRPDDAASMREVVERLGPPERHAASAAAAAHDGHSAAAEALTPCRVCRREISRAAAFCPHCGAQFPARAKWSGWGYEWKSKAHLGKWPLVHVAFGRDEQGRLRVAKGVIAIGQFAIGGITIAQFGVGLVGGFGQFIAAPLALAQFAAGLVAVGQFAIGIFYGAGMVATGLKAVGPWAKSLL
ncbi:MAG TPA: hypothetical protein VLH79_09410 [Chthonomonadales bacterium]|nr:hypothetical protein [Chthonomonadales bacterium]